MLVTFDVEIMVQSAANHVYGVDIAHRTFYVREILPATFTAVMMVTSVIKKEEMIFPTLTQDT